MTSIPTSRALRVICLVFVIHVNGEGTTTDLPDIGHCDTTPFEEGQTAEMRFHFRHINTSSERFLVDLVRASDPGRHLVRCYGENAAMACRAINESFTVTNTRSELTVSIPNASKDFEDTYELKGFFNGKELPPLSCTLKMPGSPSEGETSKAWIAGVVVAILGVLAGVLFWCRRKKRLCFKNKTVTDEDEMEKLNQTAQSTTEGNSGSAPLNDVSSVTIQGGDSTGNKQPSCVERGNTSTDFRNGMDVTDNKEQPPGRQETNSDDIRFGNGATSSLIQESAIGQGTTSGKQRYRMGATSGEEKASARQGKESENIRNGMDSRENKERSPMRQDKTPGDIRIDTLATRGAACGECASNQDPRYFFETLTQEDEERLLLAERNGHGSFLIKGHHDKTVVILSVNDNGKPLRHRIMRRPSGFHFDEKDFTSLDELTDYYKKHDIDLFGGHNICRLIKPVEAVGIDE